MTAPGAEPSYTVECDRDGRHYILSPLWSEGSVNFRIAENAASRIAVAHSDVYGDPWHIQGGSGMKMAEDLA